MSKRTNNTSTATNRNASTPIQFLKTLPTALMAILTVGMGGALLVWAVFGDPSPIFERTAIALTFIAFGLAIIPVSYTHLTLPTKA